MLKVIIHLIAYHLFFQLRDWLFSFSQISRSGWKLLENDLAYLRLCEIFDLYKKNLMKCHLVLSITAGH